MNIEVVIDDIIVLPQSPSRTIRVNFNKRHYYVFVWSLMYNQWVAIDYDGSVVPEGK